MPAAHRLALYPSNRLEDLACLLEHVLSLSPASVLTPHNVLVENPGMAHWLSMRLAQSSDLCMNVQFPMPGRFIWQLARRVLGEERVPLASPYAREVLAWRIDRQLGRFASEDDPRFKAVTAYWRDGSAEDPLKRFQLASQQADLFEQYLLFRPDWIESWSAGLAIDELAHETHGRWQGALWHRLTQENPDHPLRLQREAQGRLAELAAQLPAQVCLFAINTLPPITLQFFEQLARHTQVHLFHLNPCVDYWGDLRTEKQRAAARADQARRWLQLRDPQIAIPQESAGSEGNPLLANLGGQGREFFAALSELESEEISAFDLEPPSAPSVVSVLRELQHDILTLQDKRHAPQMCRDDSVVFRSCHGALRELQTLHDWLLHRFNEDPTLTPRDVIIMCPQVEHYAPYLAAVFETGYGGSECVPPRLPLSINDRAPRDAEPLVAGFLELLNLPDSRFQVSKILDLLRQPALQARFGLSADELPQLTGWLKDAAIHWGLNGEHKTQLSGAAGPLSDLFSWRWGLRRLLRGFAQSDSEWLAGDALLLPHVEGGQGLLLGRLLQFIERLSHYADQLRRARSAADWQQLLLEMKGAFFQSQQDADDSGAAALVEQAIGDFSRWTALAACESPLPLTVVRHWLSQHLSRPDTSNRFLTGQITFCSLEPMRSAPFRIIAILGLNDGEFPRQQVPIGFDLMAQAARRRGDRSRRGDDRYLFLEALICAREKLYLSYQGADIKTGSERQPSLVLRELMDYLQQGYGWCFEARSGEPACQLRQAPLHPFSRLNFVQPEASFDGRWLKLATAQPLRNNCIRLPAAERIEDEQGFEWLELDRLVRFFDNPPRQFAEQRLGLFLGRDEALLQDAEPFEADALVRYQARQRLMEAQWREDLPALVAEQTRLKLTGALPEGLRAEEQLDEWQAANSAMLPSLQEAGIAQLESRPFVLSLGSLRIEGRLPLVQTGQGARLLLWRPAKAKAKDRLQLWLYHLCAQALNLADESLGIYVAERPTEKAPVERLYLGKVDAPEAQLQAVVAAWRQALDQPQLLHAELGFKLGPAGWKKEGRGDNSRYVLRDNAAEIRRAAWDHLWQGGWGTSGFNEEPYVHWFWPQGAHFEQSWPALAQLYGPALHAYLNIDLSTEVDA